MQKRVVLIAGIGTSPAVLTETVWALAHRTKPVVPDEVVIVTTSTGKARIRAELLDGGVWAEMKAALARAHVKGADRLRLGETSIRVLPDAEGNEIDDLRSADDNLRAADFMLGVVRQYTEDPGTVVYASIAGGRKTMSALLLSCMSLLGRTDDKVFHVLTTPEPIGFKPAYYFPKRGVSHAYLVDRARGTQARIASVKVEVALFEVPFVKVRGLFQERFNHAAPRYSELVRAAQHLAPPAELPHPVVELDVDTGVVKVGENARQIHANAFALLFLLAHGVVDAEDLFDCLIAARDASVRDAKDLPVWFADFQESRMMNDKDDGRRPEPSLVNKLANRLRMALRDLGLTDAARAMLVPTLGKAMTYPGDKLVVKGARLADIRGYLLPAEARS